MTTFAEFESTFLAALQEERSNLQGLQGAVEAQLSAWIEHLFREYLGYSWKDFVRGEGAHLGAKGSKQLFPDLRIDILDTGLIFIECKRLGRLDGPKRQEELDDGVSQLRGYIRAHVDKASNKPKTVLGVVSDGNRWFLMGLNRFNEFHTIAEWAFLTDDPRLLAQRLWLLAKPALAQPTSPLVEFLARRTLAEVLKEKTRWLTRKVNERLPDGAVSEDLIGKWLRDAFSDTPGSARVVPAGSSSPSGVESLELEQPNGGEPGTTHPASGPRQATDGKGQRKGRKPRVTYRARLADVIAEGLLAPPVALFRKYKGTRLEARLLPDGTVEFAGTNYASCSDAAGVARGTITGRPMTTNGWSFWQYKDTDGQTRVLNDARMQLLQRKGSEPSDQ